MKTRSAILPSSLIGWAVALGAAAWSLRGAGANSVVDTDAARHAMNGAFIFDLARHGRFFAPVAYAKWYFARYPAITIPYHPPGFPAFEAIFFALFGVSAFSARLAIAVTVGGAALLLFRLIRATHRSRVLAVCVVAAFLSLPMSQLVASDVMLEFPAMLLAIASIHCLHKMFGESRWLYALAFALLGAAGIWTKQTVFLIPLPILYILLLRRWSLLRSAQVWMAGAILFAAAVALAAVGWSVGYSGISEAWLQKNPWRQLWDNFRFYLDWLRDPRLAIPLVVVAVGGALHRFGIRNAEWMDKGSDDAIYFAWLASVVSVLMLAPAISGRYLFFAYPALLVPAFSMANRIAAATIPRMKYAPSILGAALIAIAGLRTPAPFLSGPAQAASFVVDNNAKRVVYCGLTDGNFMFSMRALDRDLERAVIPCDKIPEDQDRPDTLPDFARRFGADYLILENSDRRQPWDGAPRDPGVSLERVIPQHSSQARFEGRLSIYRVYGGSPSPKEFDAPISAFGRSLKADF